MIMLRTSQFLMTLLGALLLLAGVACRQRSYKAAPLDSDRESEGFEILTDSGLADTVNSLALLTHLRRMKERYEQVFPMVNALVKVELRDEKCERSGFDFASGTLRFCRQDGVQALGTQSEDVLAREVFAALFCKSYPIVCSSLSFQGERTREFVLGAGEYFAYEQKHDSFFGEDFFSQKPFVYKYGERGGVCANAGADEHPFVNVMIDKKYTLALLRQDVEAPLFWTSRWMSEHKVCSAKQM
jgi:hypothetical protein